MDFANDPWLAGFADGEASFNIVVMRKGSPSELLRPRFSIHLREDDAEILRNLRDCFGGAWRPAPRAANDTTARHGRYVWEIEARDDLLRLADYFRRFPLRSKKARDCDTWCEAVAIYAAARIGKDAREALAPLRERLMTERRYVAA